MSELMSPSDLALMMELSQRLSKNQINQDGFETFSLALWGMDINGVSQFLLHRGEMLMIANSSLLNPEEMYYFEQFAQATQEAQEQFTQLSTSELATFFGIHSARPIQ